VTVIMVVLVVVDKMVIRNGNDDNVNVGHCDGWQASMVRTLCVLSKSSIQAKRSESLRAYVCMSICVCVYVCMCAYVCVCMRMCVCTCVCMYICVYVGVCVRVCVCT
jgi:hypothetical protein